MDEQTFQIAVRTDKTIQALARLKQDVRDGRCDLLYAKEDVLNFLEELIKKHEQQMRAL